MSREHSGYAAYLRGILHGRIKIPSLLKFLFIFNHGFDLDHAMSSLECAWQPMNATHLAFMFATSEPCPNRITDLLFNALCAPEPREHCSKYRMLCTLD